ncbi:hypothetical protein HY837_03195, partial [archaeon]|nr:hypothetical protein [archaeon]
ELNDEKIIPAFLQLLKNDPGNQNLAVKTLSKFSLEKIPLDKIKEMLDQIKSHIYNYNENTMNFFEAVIEAHGEKAIPLLLDLLENGNTVNLALISLTNMGGKVMPLLKSELNNPARTKIFKESILRVLRDIETLKDPSEKFTFKLENVKDPQNTAERIHEMLRTYLEINSLFDKNFKEIIKLSSGSNAEDIIAVTVQDSTIEVKLKLKQYTGAYFSNLDELRDEVNWAIQQAIKPNEELKKSVDQLIDESQVDDILTSLKLRSSKEDQGKKIASQGADSFMFLLPGLRNSLKVMNSYYVFDQIDWNNIEEAPARMMTRLLYYVTKDGFGKNEFKQLMPKITEQLAKLVISSIDAGTFLNRDLTLLQNINTKDLSETTKNTLFERLFIHWNKDKIGIFYLGRFNEETVKFLANKYIEAKDKDALSALAQFDWSKFSPEFVQEIITKIQEAQRPEHFGRLVYLAKVMGEKGIDFAIDLLNLAVDSYELAELRDYLDTVDWAKLDDAKFKLIVKKILKKSSHSDQIQNLLILMFDSKLKIKIQFNQDFDDVIYLMDYVDYASLPNAKTYFYYDIIRHNIFEIRNTPEDQRKQKITELITSMDVQYKELLQKLIAGNLKDTSNQYKKLQAILSASGTKNLVTTRAKELFEILFGEKEIPLEEKTALIKEVQSLAQFDLDYVLSKINEVMTQSEITRSEKKVLTAEEILNGIELEKLNHANVRRFFDYLIQNNFKSFRDTLFSLVLRQEQSGVPIIIKYLERDIFPSKVDSLLFYFDKIKWTEVNEETKYELLERLAYYSENLNPQVLAERLSYVGISSDFALKQLETQGVSPGTFLAFSSVTWKEGDKEKKIEATKILMQNLGVPYALHILALLGDETLDAFIEQIKTVKSKEDKEAIFSALYSILKYFKSIKFSAEKQKELTEQIYDSEQELDAHDFNILVKLSSATLKFLLPRFDENPDKAMKVISAITLSDILSRADSKVYIAKIFELLKTTKGETLETVTNYLKRIYGDHIDVFKSELTQAQKNALIKFFVEYSTSASLNQGKVPLYIESVKNKAKEIEKLKDEELKVYFDNIIKEIDERAEKLLKLISEAQTFVLEEKFSEAAKLVEKEGFKDMPKTKNKKEWLNWLAYQKSSLLIDQAVGKDIKSIVYERVSGRLYRGVGMLQPWRAKRYLKEGIRSLTPLDKGKEILAEMLKERGYTETQGKTFAELILALDEKMSADLQDPILHQWKVGKTRAKEAGDKLGQALGTMFSFSESINVAEAFSIKAGDTQRAVIEIDPSKLIESLDIKRMHGYSGEQEIAVIGGVPLEAITAIWYRGYLVYEKPEESKEKIPEEVVKEKTLEKPTDLEEKISENPVTLEEVDKFLSEAKKEIGIEKSKSKKIKIMPLPKNLQKVKSKNIVEPLQYALLPGGGIKELPPSYLEAAKKAFYEEIGELQAQSGQIQAQAAGAPFGVISQLATGYMEKYTKENEINLEDYMDPPHILKKAASEQVDCGEGSISCSLGFFDNAQTIVEKLNAFESGEHKFSLIAYDIFREAAKPPPALKDETEPFISFENKDKEVFVVYNTPYDEDLETAFEEDLVNLIVNEASKAPELRKLLKLPEENVKEPVPKSPLENLIKKLKNSIEEKGQSAESLDKVLKNSQSVLTIQDYLSKKNDFKGRYALGLGSKPYFDLVKIGRLHSYFELFQFTTKEDYDLAAQEYGVGKRAESAALMEAVTDQDKSLIFFLPTNMVDFEGFTETELLWLLENPEKAKNVVFVFGAYEIDRDDLPEHFWAR